MLTGETGVGVDEFESRGVDKILVMKRSRRERRVGDKSKMTRSESCEVVRVRTGEACLVDAEG